MAKQSYPLLGELDDVDSLTGQIRKRKDRYIYESIKKPLTKQYENEGWDLIRENANSNRMRKPKAHDVLFEDRVWALFARLGFIEMNKNRNFRIQYSKDPDIPGKQIDVFAADDETVILIECKSAASRKRKSFAKDILEIGSIRDAVYRSVKKALGKPKIKISWIFATSDYIISKPDKARFKDNHINHFTEEDIRYYENLLDLLGPVAKYQIFGRLFKGKSILGLNYSTPAIRGKLGGFTTYSFSIEPEVILKIGFVLHRTDASVQAFDSYQRMVKKHRIKQIENYINEGGFFPNSIIINFNTKKALKWEEVKDCEHCSTSDLGILYLPNSYHSAFIIDGQHRLYGYGNTKWKSKNTIPVVAFVNLPEREQTKVFIDINNKQKSVSKNLLMTLMGEFNWGSDNADEALAAIKTRLIDNLNNENNSNLYKRIKLLDEKGSQKRCLTKNYLIGQGLNKTFYFGATQKKKITAHGYLWHYDYQGTLDKTYEFLNTCFGFFEAELSEQWDKGSAEGGFITMNLGISTLIRLFDDILNHLKKDQIDFTKLSGEEMAARIKPFLDPVIIYLKGLPSDQIKKFRGFVGGAAVDRVLRRFQNAINLEIDEFCPDGLPKWQDESTGKYNAMARNIGDEMQLKIREFIFEKLKKEYGHGNKSWWTKGVPKDIQKRCSIERIEQENGEDEDYMFLLDYQTIIKKQKKILIDYFTKPGNEQIAIDKKIAWFSDWNKIRNKYSHPEKGKVTKEEYEFILETRDWLYKKNLIF